MKKYSALAIFSLFSGLLAGQEVLRDTFELRTRGGLPNFFHKVLTGQAVKVGYFGGSLTDAEGWRVKSLNWFREYYNNENIAGFNASIGGTNSKFGVFRIEEHLLVKDNFDLIFVEYAVNDLTNRESEIEKCMEGIVRKIWDKNPQTDICFIYALRDGEVLDTILTGKLPLQATKHDKIAEYYNIPAIFLGVRVVQDLNAGTLVMTGTIADPLNDTTADGKYVLTTDGVHPTNYGHELYAQIVAKCFQVMDGDNQPSTHVLKPDLDPENYQQAKMLSYEPSLNYGLEEASLIGQYDFLDEFLQDGNQFLLGEEPDMHYEFDFYGDVFGLSIIRGPQTGTGLVNMDDTEREFEFFDAYCDIYRQNSFFMSVSLDTHHVKISPGDHLTIEEKEAILMEDRRADIQNNPGGYLHNYIIFDKILINGSMVEKVTGISDQPGEITYSVFYSGDHITITLPADQYVNSWAVIHSITGQLVFMSQLTRSLTTIPFKPGHGIYIISIGDDSAGKLQNYKIVL